MEKSQEKPIIAEGLLKAENIHKSGFSNINIYYIFKHKSQTHGEKIE
jgi:hypothetical protein